MPSIPVISKDGHPLMPCHHYGRVKRWLKQGKAVIRSRWPFVVQLCYDVEMAGSCLWNIKDAPLLGIFVKSHLEEHPSCVPLCLPAWRTEVLLPDVFRFGERTCANLKKNPASFLSAPFRHTLFSGEYDALEGCASSCLLGAITDSLSERHEAPYHVSEELADRAFFRVMNELAEGASKRKG